MCPVCQLGIGLLVAENRSVTVFVKIMVFTIKSKGGDSPALLVIRGLCFAPLCTDLWLTYMTHNAVTHSPEGDTLSKNEEKNIQLYKKCV